MLLSVVILTRNRKNELCRALNSCIENKINNMEIIIIDNASSDGTKTEVFKLFSEEITGVPLRYYYQSTNTGVAGGRNIGFSKAEGKYIFLLDDDAWIKTKDTFSILINRMEKELSTAAISTAVYDIKSSYYQECTCISNSSKVDGLPEILYYTGGASIIRKDVFKKSLYPDTLFYGSEEIYSSLYIHENGMNILYDKSLLLIHEPSTQSRLSESEILFNNIFNLFLVKYLSYPSITKIFIQLGLLLRIAKYFNLNKDAFRKCNNLFKERYRKKDENKIRFLTIYKIYRKFGMKAIV